MPQTKELEKEKISEDIDSVYTVIVWNDNVNTFEHVTDCLIRFCGHTKEQAEQCTYIIHFKGKCDVKRGNKEKMMKVYNNILSCGITATLEN